MHLDCVSRDAEAAMIPPFNALEFGSASFAFKTWDFDTTTTRWTEIVGLIHTAPRNRPTLSDDLERRSTSSNAAGAKPGIVWSRARWRPGFRSERHSAARGLRLLG